MTVDEYKAIRNQAGKDGLNAILFFFIGLPLIIAGIASLFMFPIETSLVLLAIAGIWYALKKHGYVR